MSLLHLSGRKDARITQQAVRLVDFKELRKKKAPKGCRNPLLMRVGFGV